jgi:cell division protein FtsQ
MSQVDTPPRARERLVGLLRSGRLPALFVALACGITVWGFLEAADYQVDSVLVHGSSVGDPNQVALASGALGHSIFRIDPDVTAANIARLPWVERASVRFETPDMLVVDLTERTPVAVWSDGASTYLVDEDGQILFSGDAPALPHIVAPGATLAPGQAVEPLDVAAVRAIAQQLGDRLAALAWVDDLGFEATLTDQRTIRFGDADRMQFKLAGLTAILPHAPEDWEMLDLSEPERPYFR